MYVSQVEICLTSNIQSERLSSLSDHHFGLYLIFLSSVAYALPFIRQLIEHDCAAELYKANHPLALCTDDSGLFSTSLSNEYRLAASTFGVLITIFITRHICQPLYLLQYCILIMQD